MENGSKRRSKSSFCMCLFGFWSISGLVWLCEAIDDTVEEALRRAEVKPEELTAVAVTVGPGLGLCLEVGVKKALQVAAQHRLPLARRSAALGKGGRGAGAPHGGAHDGDAPAIGCGRSGGGVGRDGKS